MAQYVFHVGIPDMVEKTHVALQTNNACLKHVRCIFSMSHGVREEGLRVDVVAKSDVFKCAADALQSRRRRFRRPVSSNTYMI